MDRLARDRVKWRSRRGLLELDLVFERFVPTLKDEELSRFGELLELPDNDLWDIVTGRRRDYDPKLNDIVARVRAA